MVHGIGVLVHGKVTTVCGRGTTIHDIGELVHGRVTTVLGIGELVYKPMTRKGNPRTCIK